MEIETERLILREFVAEDATAVYTYQNDPLYLRYYHWEERTLADAQKFIDQFISQQQETPRLKYQLAITLKSTRQLIGNCGIRQAKLAIPHADMGYEIASPYWGNGYTTEATQSLLNFGFVTIKLRRVWAQCLADNTRSIRVLEKLGMHLERHLPHNKQFKGRWWDMLVYAINRYEWEENGLSGDSHIE